MYELSLRPPRRPLSVSTLAALAAAPLALTSPSPAQAASATARIITSAADLIGGPAATGRAGQGDVLLQNDHIRVIIRGPGRTVSAAMFGGHIIDADLRRGPGQDGADQFGQLSTFINLAHSMNATTVAPFTAGLPAGAAGVKACGPSDLYDFVDLENAFALVPPLTWLLGYDFDAPLGFNICNTYTLGADDRFVAIRTEMTNDSGESIWVTAGDVIDSGSDVEYWLQNEDGIAFGKLKDQYTWGGFGPQPYGHLGLMGFLGDGVSYGYTAPLEDGEPAALALSVAGVTATAVGSTSMLGILRGSKRELIRVYEGGTRSYTRYFIVGEDLGEVAAEAWRIHGVATTPITGTVTEAGTGAPLAGVRVTALAGASMDRPAAQLITGADGRFSGALPPGNYGLIAAQGFDRMHLERDPLLTPVAVTVPSSGSATASLTLGTTATVNLTVLDGGDLSGATTLPARVGFYDPSVRPEAGEDRFPSQQRDPLSQVMDVTGDPLRRGLVKEVILTESPTSIHVPPGTWDVVVTHGPEYDRFQTRKIFSAGSTTSLEAILTQVVDTGGYLSADLHVHAMNSPDSPVDNGDRVRSFAADGVDLLVSTDHDFITDFQPIVEELGLDDRLIALPGLELTTFALGHFNAFPLEVDPVHRLGGALDWADNDYVCDVGQDTSLPSEQDNLTPGQFLTALDDCYEGVQLRQINHVRGDLQGYFTAIGLDLSALGTSGETQADPLSLRMARGSDLFDPTSFEVIEVMNEYGFQWLPTLLSDAFALNNLGYPKALTAVSDTHYLTHVPSGIARTWLKMDVDDPGILNHDATFADQFVESLGGLRATGGTGPFLTAEVARAGSSTYVGMGGTVSAPAGNVNVRIRIQQPRWMTFDTIALFVNTPVQATWDPTGYKALADLGPLRTWSLPDPTFTPREVAVTTLNPSGASRLDYQGTVSLSLPEDSWIVVALWGGQVSVNAPSGDTWDTVAFTSPIFVDVDGGGFAAPCGPEVYDPAQGCDLIDPPEGDWDDRQAQPNPHTGWVDELWRIVQLEPTPSTPRR